MLERMTFVTATALWAACTSATVTSASERERAVGALEQRPGSALSAESAAGPEAPPRAVIAKLRLRDVDLIIASSAAGPRFTLSSRQGATIAADLEDVEFAERYPALHQLFRSALAGPAGSYLDARLDSRSPADSAEDLAPVY
jgi:hypothetical protein